MRRHSKYTGGKFVTINATKYMTRGVYTGGNTEYQERFGVYWGLVTGGSSANQITLGSSSEWTFWKGVY